MPVKLIKKCFKKSKKIKYNSNLTQFAIDIYRKYWLSPSAIIVSLDTDYKSVIHGSILASYLKLPFIPFKTKQDVSLIQDYLNKIDSKSIIYVNNNNENLKGWFNEKNIQLTEYSIPIINKKIIKHLGKENIKSIILANTQIPSDLDIDSTKKSQNFTEHIKNNSFYILPYMCFIRKSIPALVNRSDGLFAENIVEKIIKSYSITPNNVIIIGDYDIISLISSSNDDEYSDYEVEPCSGHRLVNASDMGVGRIPFNKITECSIVFTRNVIRNIIIKKPKKILMIANPNSDYDSLPLCETISRATAKEFKNFKLKLKDYYQRPIRIPEILKNVINSNLIIYQGHIYDFDLFEDKDEDDDEEENIKDDNIDTLSMSYNSHKSISDLEDRFFYIDRVKVTNIDEIEDNAILKNNKNNNKELITEDKNEDDEDDEDKNLLPSIEPYELRGLPFIILQSCSSLDESARKLLKNTAVGIIGSVTSIHSASGSAFLNALFHGVLYQNDTIGEALRDARNYLLCIVELKKKRVIFSNLKQIELLIVFIYGVIQILNYLITVN